MISSIWKYTLIPATTNIVKMPLGAQILSVDTQNDEIVVYALVDTEENIVTELDFKTYGTGHQIDINIHNYTFLGTAKLQNGSLMFHVFYKRTTEQA